jgi:preprotein translocase subunit SecY
MKPFIAKAKLFFTDKALLNRVLFTLAIFAVFRLLASIPLPGTNPQALVQFLSTNQFFGVFNLLSGSSLSNFSILFLGVGPFITASIILQLLTLLSPRLKELYHEEGEMGRKKFNQYSRLLTVPIAIVQSLAFIAILSSQGVLTIGGIFPKISIVAVSVAGSLIAMWLGELISEFGIGNGVSMIIFAGIVSRLPKDIAQAAFSYTPSQIPLYIGFIIVAILIVVGVIYITEAERPIPVTYAKQVRGGALSGTTSTYLPLRINQAGVMPIIFGISILLLPRLLGQVLEKASSASLQNIGHTITGWMANTWIYSIAYFILVFLFTYFYTAVTFDADAMAKNLQNNGAFIPSVRPGIDTAEYVAKILYRITFFGAIFLAVIAVLPQIFTGISGNQAITLGGTSLLIVVGVVIDLMKRVDAKISMMEY